MKTAGNEKPINYRYIWFGCAWLYFLTSFFIYLPGSKAYLYSIIRGIYAAITYLVLQPTYPAMKNLQGYKELIKLNDELIKTNEMYKSLYQEYSHKQALLKSLIDSVPAL